MKPILFLTLLSQLLLLSACQKPSIPLLEEVKQRGELRVITRNNPTTYYEGVDGPTGFEYDLVKMFAASIGVNVKLILPDAFEDLLPTVMEGKADFAAAGLTITESRKQHVRFSLGYQKITQQLLYFPGTPRPKSIEDLDGFVLEVVAGSSHAERLAQLKDQGAEFSWTENRDLDSEELFLLLKDKLIDYTVADSNEVELARRYYPELKIAFDISEPEALGWAFQKSNDTSLYDAAQAFLIQLRESGKLTQLIDRHYGHTETFDFVELRNFRRHVLTRLPKYRESFEQAAEATGINWRMLAAIGYQESHWNPKAVSPTGVRGIMMLTQRTAKQMGVKKRTDPHQSIMGGAKYFARVLKKLPDRIPMPDRIWLAMASYNIGYGHLEDARRLTEKLDGDPDRWLDVKSNLPKLNKRKWHQKLRYGYARGREAVRYVTNIRSYYDILTWMLQQAEEPKENQHDVTIPPLPAL